MATKYTLTLAPCFHTEVLTRQPAQDEKGWPKPRNCPEKGCRGKRRVCELHVIREKRS